MAIKANLMAEEYKEINDDETKTPNFSVNNPIPII